MKKFLVFMFCGIALFMHSPLWGQEAKSKWENLNFITTDELKKIYDAKEDFLLINALSPIEFDEITITGSVNIPFEHLMRGVKKLPDDKKAKLIFFCKGPL